MRYLAYGTKPDISFTVRQLSRYNVNLRKDHLWVVKRIVRYFCGTIEMGLTYSQQLNNQMSQEPLLIRLMEFADSSFARNPDDWKLIIGYYFFFNRIVVCWYSKKQKTVSTLIIEVEYIALGHAVRDAVSIQRFIYKLGLNAVTRVSSKQSTSMFNIITSKK